jgi:hypothetical protein
MKKITPLLIASISMLISANLQGNGGIVNGEIIFEQTGNRTIEATAILYVASDLESYHMDFLQFTWGDGGMEIISRANGPDIDGNGIPNGEMISGIFSKHIYKGIHTYEELGERVISVSIPNRNGGILNINYPYSDLVTLYIEATVQVQENFEKNHSPVLLEPPVDYGFSGHKFLHVVNAFDIDDDSIAYELISPLRGHGLEVPNYLEMESIYPGDDNQLYLDEETGLLVWDSPQAPGLYNIAILVKSYRNGEIIDRVMRDMQILILDGGDPLPEITLNTIEYEIQEVSVGDEISVSVFTQDEDATQEVELTSSSGLYEYFGTTSQFSAQVNSNEGNGAFGWIVGEEHVRTQPYQIVFKSKDNYQGVGYANFKLIRYRVLEELISEPREIRKKFEVKIFPNPAGEFIRVELSGINDELQYQIIDIKGRIAKTGRLNPAENIIFLNELASGQYVLRIVDREGNRVHKAATKFIK